MLRLYGKSGSRSHDPASCPHAGCENLPEAAAARSGVASSAGAGAKNLFRDGAGASASVTERIVPGGKPRAGKIGAGAGARGGSGGREESWGSRDSRHVSA